MKDKDLPPHLTEKNGAVYYRQAIRRDGKVIKEIWHRLAKTKAEARQIYYRDFYEKTVDVTTMNDVFEWYSANVASKKAASTYKVNLESIANLRIFFGKMLPCDITPVMVYKYIDIRGEKSKRGANMDKALLSHIFTKLIQRGTVTINPCRDVKGHPEKKRTRRVTDDEFNAVKSIAHPIIAGAMDFAYITALRKGDVLRVELKWFTSEGINMPTHKTDVFVLFRWTPELKECVDRIRAIPRKIRGMYLFTTRWGKRYEINGFNAMWQRTNRKALELGLIKERFRFHDIRRKRAKDAEEKYGIEFARKLLAHETQGMTANYVRGIQILEAKI